MFTIQRGRKYTMTSLVIPGFSEKLFKKLESSTERFEVRVMMMDVIARLIGVHQVNVHFFLSLCRRI
jgi:protein SDA1